MKQIIEEEIINGKNVSIHLRLIDVEKVDQLDNKKSFKGIDLKTHNAKGSKKLYPYKIYSI